VVAELRVTEGCFFLSFFVVGGRALFFEVIMLSLPGYPFAFEL
jgi:hypothetical protein